LRDFLIGFIVGWTSFGILVLIIENWLYRVVKRVDEENAQKLEEYIKKLEDKMKEAGIEFPKF